MSLSWLEKKETKIHLSLTEKISANFQNLQGCIYATGFDRLNVYSELKGRLSRNIYIYISLQIQLVGFY